MTDTIAETMSLPCPMKRCPYNAAWEGGCILLPADYAECIKGLERGPGPECDKKDEEISRWQARCHENDCKADSYDHLESECVKLRAQLAALEGVKP